MNPKALRSKFEEEENLYLPKADRLVERLWYWQEYSKWLERRIQLIYAEQKDKKII